MRSSHKCNLTQSPPSGGGTPPALRTGLVRMPTARAGAHGVHPKPRPPVPQRLPGRPPSFRSPGQPANRGCLYRRRRRPRPSCGSAPRDWEDPEGKQKVQRVCWEEARCFPPAPHQTPSMHPAGLCWGEARRGAGPVPSAGGWSWVPARGRAEILRSGGASAWFATGLGGLLDGGCLRPPGSWRFLASPPRLSLIAPSLGESSSFHVSSWRGQV